MYWSFQVWRPIVGPVEDSPLGLIDATTLSQEDIVGVPLYFPDNKVHEVNYVTHNPQHQ